MEKLYARYAKLAVNANLTATLQVFGCVSTNGLRVPQLCKEIEAVSFWVRARRLPLAQLGTRATRAEDARQLLPCAPPQLPHPALGIHVQNGPAHRKADWFPRPEPIARNVRPCDS